MNQIGVYLEAKAVYREVEQWMRRALEIDERSFGPDHPDVAIRLGNLGSLLREKGKPDEGKKLIERALSIFEKSFDADHPLVVETKRRLATFEE
jgi:tetratricopeptide (TPR) repeat protein